MKILMTGGTGFIGSNLASSLIHSGHDVDLLVRNGKSIRLADTLCSDVGVYSIDSYESIEAAMFKSSPDCVFHLATLYVNKHKPETIPDLISSNVLFGTQILEAMIATKCSSFLNFGTRWQHISNERFNPANLYAATKEALLCILAYYHKKGINSKTLELSDTFGPGDTRKKVVDLMITACKNNVPIDMSFGEQMLDISYIGDICDYIVGKCVNDVFFDNGTISLSGYDIKLKELGLLIEQCYARSGILRWGELPYREDEVMAPVSYYPIEKVSSMTLVERVVEYCSTR